MNHSGNTEHSGKHLTIFANVTGCLLIAAGLGIIIFRNFLCNYSLAFITSLISRDGNLLGIGLEGFKLCLLGAGVLLVILGLITLLRRKRPFCHLFSSVNDYVFHEDVRRFFFPLNCFLPQKYYIITFWFSLLFTNLLIFLFRFHLSPLVAPLFMEDHILEWITFYNFLFASILLITSMFLMFRQNAVKINKSVAIIVVVCLTLICLFFAAEEISYGQRIFGWKTTGIFQNNYQHETNFHNFLNPWMDDLSNFTGSLLFFLLLFGWLRHREFQSLTFRILFPHPSLFFMTASVFAITVTGQSDVMEEILSIMALLYCLTMWLILIKRI